MWLPVDKFPKNGNRCLIKYNDGTLSFGFWGKASHVPIYGIIDESFADYNDIEVCTDKIVAFIPELTLKLLICTID